MTEYTYDPLPNVDYMRLLTVAPFDGPDDPITGSLQPAPIGKAVVYSTLSYSWGMDEDGDATLCESMLVDGKVLKITRNLYQGLRRIFARDTYSLPIWIDAVCIDQTNVVERSAQVARIAEIYANAQQLLIWLGEPKIPGDEAQVAAMFYCIYKHSNLLRAQPRKEQRDRVWTALAQVMRSPGPLDHAGEGVDANLRGFSSEDEQSAVAQELNRLLAAFTSARYWRRRWITQEIFHSDHDRAFVIWGSAIMSLPCVTVALEFCANGDPWWEEMSDRTFEAILEYFDVNSLILSGKIGGLLSLRQKLRSNVPHDRVLQRVLSASSDQACADPRDRLYALLSIDTTTRLRPDYCLPPAAVYASFVAEVLRNGNFLASMLIHAALQRRETDCDEISEGLPSWCIDLRRRFVGLIEQTPLGPCWVDRLSILTCSVAIVGMFKAERTRKDCAQMLHGREISHTMLKGLKLMYLYYLDIQASDMICVAEKPPSRATRFRGLILREIEGRARAYRIVGCSDLDVLTDEWDLPYDAIQQIQIYRIRSRSSERLERSNAEDGQCSSNCAEAEKPRRRCRNFLPGWSPANDLPLEELSLLVGRFSLVPAHSNACARRTQKPIPPL